MKTLLTHSYKILRVLAVVAMSAACSTNTLGDQYPAKSNWTSSFLSHVIGGEQTPAGVNNWDCRPKPGDSPVVLVHGTFSSTMYSFGALGPALANRGLCVYAADYGASAHTWFKGVDAVDVSAKQIAEFVRSVKGATGHNKVTLVGHSQGGLIGFYYLKLLDGHQDVSRFVALAPSVGGTVISKTPNRDKVDYCLACADQHPDSALLKRLRAGQITVPGVQYTVLATRNDKVVLPLESQFVREPGVNNLFIQDRLPDSRVSHSGMLYNTDTVALIVDLVQGKTHGQLSGAIGQ
ncbi:MAG TPA: alpha/beta fold hydrolase [Limnobacter sp.]|nr:alpha/beta fold hydrolase [Limnobacter sp.]